MRCSVAVVLVGLVVLAGARPNPVFEYEGEDHTHSQSGTTGERVEGEYRWTSPEGLEFYVKYIADEKGYRVLESNAVPVSSYGSRADGQQVNFDDYDWQGDSQTQV